MRAGFCHDWIFADHVFKVFAIQLNARKRKQIKLINEINDNFLGGGAEKYGFSAIKSVCLHTFGFHVHNQATPYVNSLYVRMTSGRILSVSETWRHSLKYVHQFSHTDHPPRKKTERSRQIFRQKSLDVLKVLGRKNKYSPNWWFNGDVQSHGTIPEKTP